MATKQTENNDIQLQDNITEEQPKQKKTRTKTTKKQQTTNTEETAPKQKNTVEVQPQDIIEVNTENVTTTENNTTAPDELSKNYDFFKQVQNVKPYSSNGGSNITPSTAQQNAKRKKKNHMQRISRRLNKNR